MSQPVVIEEPPLKSLNTMAETKDEGQLPLSRHVLMS